MEKELFDALDTLIKNADKNDYVDDTDKLGIEFGVRRMLGKNGYTQNYSKGCSIKSEGRVAYNKHLREIEDREIEKQEQRNDKIEDRDFQIEMQSSGFKLDVLSSIIGIIVGFALGLLSSVIF